MEDHDYAPRHRAVSDAAYGALPGVGSRRRRHGPVLPGLLVVATLLAFVVLKDPTGTWRRVINDATGGATNFAFIKTERNGDPVGWDPCSPIHYVVNPEGAPAGWADTVDAAFRTVREASRFRFVDDGTTTEREFERRTERNVLIAWAGADEVEQLEGKAAGIGGATPLRHAGRTQFVSGVVVLDAEEYAAMSRTGRYGAQVMILAHEIGHVLGLDHVDDPDQLMDAKYIGQRGFGAGDKRGLDLLHDLPCASD